jgi:hypothetical protein
MQNYKHPVEYPQCECQLEIESEETLTFLLYLICGCFFFKVYVPMMSNILYGVENLNFAIWESVSFLDLEVG